MRVTILFNLRVYNCISHAIQRAIVGHAKQHSVFLSGSIYKSPVEFNVVVQRGDTFPHRLPLGNKSSSREIHRCVEHDARHRRRQGMRAGESLT